MWSNANKMPFDDSGHTHKLVQSASSLTLPLKIDVNIYYIFVMHHPEDDLGDWLGGAEGGGGVADAKHIAPTLGTMLF